MRSPALTLAAASLVACTTAPMPGDECDGVEILGACYHRTTAPDILWPVSAAAADLDGDGAHDVITVCTGVTTPFGLCLLELDGAVTRLDLAWIGSGAARVSAAEFTGDATPDASAS